MPQQDSNRSSFPLVESHLADNLGNPRKFSGERSWPSAGFYPFQCLQRAHELPELADPAM